MPAPSFVLTPSFDWSAPPDPAPLSAGRQSDRPTPAPKPRKPRVAPRDRLRVAKLLAAKPAARKRARGRLPQNTLTVLIDRLEAAIAAGRIDLLADDGETPAVEITTGELSLLLAILLPEEWPFLRPASQPTATAPGSKHRIQAYAARVAAGESLYHAYDACPVRGDADGRLVAAGKLALAIVQRANGSGPRVLGWA